MQEITEAQINALGQEGIHDLEGLDRGRYMQMHAVIATSFDLSTMAVDRDSGIEQAMPPETSDDIKGFMITLVPKEGSPEEITAPIMGLVKTVDRSVIAALSDQIAEALHKGEWDDAISAIQKESVEYRELKRPGY